MIKIAIVDDHLMVIEGIKSLINTSNDMVVTQTFNTLNELSLGLEKELPNILLLDINLPDGNGVIACKELVKKYPDLKILGLTNFEDLSFVKQMIKNGAKGYLLKNTNKTQLFEAIHQIINGDIYLSETMKHKLLEDSLGKSQDKFIPRLTNREQEVLALIIKEYTTKEIAEKLFVTSKTVEAHRTNLIQKLGVKNTAGLVRVAFEKGLT